jgi:hypothetical protein
VAPLLKIVQFEIYTSWALGEDAVGVLELTLMKLPPASRSPLKLQSETKYLGSGVEALLKIERWALFSLVLVKVLLDIRIDPPSLGLIDKEASKVQFVAEKLVIEGKDATSIRQLCKETELSRKFGIVT